MAQEKHPSFRRYPPEVKERAVQLVLTTTNQQNGERHAVVSRNYRPSSQEGRLAYCSALDQGASSVHGPPGRQAGPCDSAVVHIRAAPGAGLERSRPDLGCLKEAE
jgi:hypothetical protein